MYIKTVDALPQCKTFELEALDSQDVDCLLTLVGETQILRVPLELDALQVGAVVGDAVHQLVNVNVHTQSLPGTHNDDSANNHLFTNSCC